MCLCGSEHFCLAFVCSHRFAGKWGGGRLGGVAESLAWICVRVCGLRSFGTLPVTSIRQRCDDQTGNVAQVLHAIPDVRGHHADNNYFRFLCTHT